KAMEEKMRAEIESQMRSGNFDMSKLPPDFRPEGAFLPPEAYSRPPDGSMPPPGTMPPPGDFQYPQYPREGTMPPPDGAYPPPTEFVPPPAVPDEPVSMGNQFVANVITILQSLLGGR
ncbi:hypothetical protein HY971_04120, partial [Candidatus Kaiserbacteria bacterium]|nr:hypothetical protein [Candidatus Kaiserbacteria bacterium]